MTAAQMNTGVRDNLNALKTPPSTTGNINVGADYTIASTTYANVDATNGNLSLQITTTGGDILVTFAGSVTYVGTAAADSVYFDVTLDGTRQGGDDGILVMRSSSAGIRINCSFVFWILAPSAGAHTINLQWKVSDAGFTATMPAGAGTSKGDVHPQMTVREVS